MRKLFLFATTCLMLAGSVAYAGGNQGGKQSGTQTGNPKDCKVCEKKHCTGKDCAKYCHNGKCVKG